MFYSPVPYGIFYCDSVCSVKQLYRPDIVSIHELVWFCSHQVHSMGVSTIIDKKSGEGM